ncbi:MAG: M20/M25/M40 family metallo-hydrolase, partial [candidate division Zixibacteria bacterium]|nr:M20/M25/M40 family metallo-hydrolase [candidate division Zixibacteria bacterium]
MRRFLILMCLPMLVAGSCLAQYEISADSLRTHIAVLASDSLEGREVGEAGELKAAAYIQAVFEHAGIAPRGDNGGYLQEFDFIKRIELGPENRLTVNGTDLEPQVDFLPLHQSADTSFSFSSIVDVGYGIITDDSSHNDYAGLDVAGKPVLIRRHTPPAPEHDTIAADTTFDRFADLNTKILTALQHDAAGVFFITPTDHDDTLMGTGVTRVASKDVPIVFLRRHALEKLSLDLDAPNLQSLVGATDLERVRDTGYNVLGYLPGRSSSTIIIGAHYDHLGWGGPSSRYTGEEKRIHYGADDNGSGTAALLELARHYRAREETNRHSMLFIAFSGEEAGLLGSSYFVRNWTVNRDSALMMINMDMIGRLQEQEKGLLAMGVGTAQEFADFFEARDTAGLKVTVTQSGAGPSDHAAFYNDSIPVLNFFTGAHEDYHKPSDVAELIDYDGIVKVTDLVTDVISCLDDYTDMLTFVRTKDAGPGGRRTSLSVTLGVMPDFVSEVKGFRIDGVSPDRPGDRAGLIKGDIIIRLGNVTIDDIYAYMSALGKLRKGDST